MSQFDVYPNPDAIISDDMPYVIDLQADYLRDLPTRILAPLARPAAIVPSPHLNPMFPVENETLALMTNHLVSLPATLLGKPVASLADHRTDIIAALDFLFTGI